MYEIGDKLLVFIAEYKRKADESIDRIESNGRELSGKDEFYRKTNKLITDINETPILNNLNIEVETSGFQEINKQLEKLIDSIKLLSENKATYDGFDFLIFELQNYVEEIISIVDRVPILEQLTGSNQSVAIVGTNGSGKSTLVDYLKSSQISNMTVITAQKYLAISSFQSRSNSYIKTTQMELNNEMRTSKAKMGDEDFSDRFVKSIIAVVNEHIEVLSDNDRFCETNESIFKKIKKIYKEVFPYIDLEVDATNRMIIPNKNTETYDLNMLSDGEKVALFYLIQIMMTEENSFVVVDEPETYLHTALAINLWQTLLVERSDCRFIFVSHNIDFIQSLPSIEKVWIKKFSYPDKWIIEKIEGGKLPETLLLHILGSKKNVLFIEGTEKNSLDYQVFNLLFNSDYTVLPVGGHDQVISYTKAYNELNLNGNLAKGIIDRDFHQEVKIEKLKEHNILVMEFNEIEMLLLSEEIIIATVGEWPNYQERINKFKSAFFDKITERKDAIALEYAKFQIDSLLENQRIRKPKKIADIVSQLSALSTFDVTSKNAEMLEKLKFIVEKKDYSQLLKICSLKREIIGSLANNMLDQGYTDRAMNKLLKDNSLCKTIRQTYFSEI